MGVFFEIGVFIDVRSCWIFFSYHINTKKKSL